MDHVIQAKKTALITGAASGVGFAVAKRCRDEGMHLALLDIDEKNLAKAKNTLADMDPCLMTEAYVLDVADVPLWEETARQIAQTFPDIDLVVLNAGKGFKPDRQDSKNLKPWLDGNYWRKTMDTNVYGPLNGLNALLPILISSKARTPKSIVITGSKQGITNPPGAGNPAYNASKAAIKNLTEHLAYDLRSDPSTAHISVHLLIPGWTWTGLMGNVGPTNEEDVKKPAGAWYPSQVAEELLNGLKTRSFYIVCPDGETDRALDQARMKWASEDVVEGRPALSRWDENWKTRAEEMIQMDAESRRV
ncbi:hypothetical protein N7448_002865 [Penicillium atrosanguineum]|uniref:Short chain dehydrogenase/reductase n=1 Tax=Penicillium atrosanguineum TaxID=1132637 RepID=A0A9W9U391_9EURO|nr:uncharacterized protein N7443_001838 [Penicillium atrosanguineum]KAJ5121733.1 hypothetical protein N7526_008670 [Penicillium atrosanguineum]KAJ5139457.1 hypothetical protein N7448_002865 [Penicillium atrosanguineum]KAJ5309377.1 hypothetical protein N7443_001838 [Penicillium atrosanguineum]KAJ5314897.1 hypothetical protein N7476_005204 [Penicillium atrosanguineum]